MRPMPSRRKQATSTRACFDEKRFDAGFPDAGRGGRGRRFRCGGGPGLDGIGGGLFSGQACAPVSERLVRAKLHCMTAFTRRGFLAASSLGLAACAQRRIAIPPAPALPRLAHVRVSAGPRDPQHGGVAALPPGGIRGARGEARCQDRDPQLRAWRRRDHALLGNRPTGGGSCAARRRARVRRDRLRRGGTGHRAPLAGTRVFANDLRARNAAADHFQPGGRPVGAGLRLRPPARHARIPPPVRRGGAHRFPALPIFRRRRLRRALAAAVHPVARSRLCAAAAGKPEQRGGIALSGSRRR